MSTRLYTKAADVLGHAGVSYVAQGATRNVADMSDAEQQDDADVI